jgi:AcrR family transcriptional regulator
MFVKYGLKSVRMDDIASSMGISKRTIYELFGDKENLIEAAVMNYFLKKHECDMQRTSRSENIIERLILGLSGAEESIQQSMILMNDLKKFYPKVYTHIMEEGFEKRTEAIRQAIDTGVREGVFLDNIGTELSVSLFVDLMQTINERISSAMSARGFAESVRFCMLFFVRGISTLKGIKQIDKYLMEKQLATN